MRTRSYASLKQAILLATTILAAPGFAAAAQQIPSGQWISPEALPGAAQQLLNPGLALYPNFVAGQALLTQLSPDGSTLAIICAGQNSLVNAAGATDSAASTQWIFLFDVSGANAAAPVLKQAIPQVNAHVGLVWAPDGSALYAAGGNDDAVYVYTATAGVWAQSGKIALGHSSTHANAGVGLFVQPNTSGLAISADGKTLVAANNYNDSISVIDTATQTVRYEHDLRPYFVGNEGTPGVAGGEYPFAVALKGNVAYVSSPRDREVVVVDISSPTAGQLVTRIKLQGNALGMTFSKNQGKLYVAQDNADQVAIISTATNTVKVTIDTRGPKGTVNGPHATGAAPLSVRMDPTGNYVYAVNAGANSIAVISAKSNNVLGVFPTNYEPTDVAFSADGAYAYIINGKSVTGPNPDHLTSKTASLTTTTYPGGNTAANNAANASNEYQFQLEHASLTTVPTANLISNLSTLTAQVATNNNYGTVQSPADSAVMGFMRKHIDHVIYVVKENRTFDQVLGDLTNGANADPARAVFGNALTPNFHALSNNFVTLDNFMDPGDGSMDGWSWAMSGRVNNTQAITQQINYAFVNRGLSYESEGSNRNVPVGLDTAGRDAATTGAFSSVGATVTGGAANILPGTANHAATDATFGTQQGYIFNAVLNAGMTVRNYGFLVNNIGSIGTISAPVKDPFASGTVQVAALNPQLLSSTDLYFRGYDQNYPDMWRYNEWKREFDQYVAGGTLPNLSLVRFSHDHMGNFGTALGGVNTPETQQADDDLAVGKLVEAVSNSPFADSTIIIVTEDDCQDGPDHVDSHRATAYVAGPYVKKNAVVSTRYSQVNALRTIEDLLGTQHINLNTAHAAPMSDVFSTKASNAAWTFSATASTILSTTTVLAAAELSTMRFAEGPAVHPAHTPDYWDSMTRGFDFSEADQVPADLFNRVLWAGLKANAAYPKLSKTTLNGLLDASQN